MAENGITDYLIVAIADNTAIAIWWDRSERKDD